MERLTAFFLAASIACQASAAEEFECLDGSYAGTVFTLSIDRSFHKPTAFRLCEVRKVPFLLVKSEADGAAQIVKYDLPSKDFDQLKDLYEAALEFDVKDSEFGFDGSSWCLETFRGNNHLKACFWSPDYEQERRRTKGLVDLGKALWSYGKFGKEYGELY